MAQTKEDMRCERCDSSDLKISQATMNGFDANTAIYGFTKYHYHCNSCGHSANQWVG